MEHEKLEYKVVMDDGSDSEVLGRLRDLEFAGAVYMAAVAKYPKRNVYLRQGAHIIRQNLGEPKPEPPPEPALPDWNVSLIRGSKMDFRGTVMARDQASATEAAIARFNLSAEQAKRLVVSLRR